MVHLGPLSAISCPNGAGCPHDIEQHRYEPNRERWECTVDDCWENPYRTVTIYSPAAGLTASSYSRLCEVHGPDVTFEFFEYPHIGVDDRPSWWQRLWRWR